MGTSDCNCSQASCSSYPSEEAYCHGSAHRILRKQGRSQCRGPLYGIGRTDHKLNVPRSNGNSNIWFAGTAGYYGVVQIPMGKRLDQAPVFP